MPQESSSNLKSELLKSLKIGVLFGGDSSERKISLKSGRAVRAALDRAGFRTIWIDPRDRSRTLRQLKTVDVAFIALHGKGGEDGEIQHFLEKLRMPYIGSDVRGSRLAFDKTLSKQIFKRSGIPTPAGLTLRSRGWARKLKALPGPYFFKPPREGSSIGAFAVEDLKANAEKIERAFSRFGEMLVEQRIDGREFTVGVLGRQVLPVVELKPRRSFYDFRAKYTKGMTDYQVPARISAKLRRQLQSLGRRTHEALGLRDFSRIDMMVDRAGRAYVLEANSIPGFTEFSLLPKAAKAAGISFEELCSRLVAGAWKRAGKRRVESHGQKKTR